ncbi:hypothetical protein ACWXVT_02140 [Mycoplasma sp. 1573]
MKKRVLWSALSLSISPLVLLPTALVSCANNAHDKQRIADFSQQVFDSNYIKIKQSNENQNLLDNLESQVKKSPFENLRLFFNIKILEIKNQNYNSLETFKQLKSDIDNLFSTENIATFIKEFETKNNINKKNDLVVQNLINGKFSKEYNDNISLLLNQKSKYQNDNNVIKIRISNLKDTYETIQKAINDFYTKLNTLYSGNSVVFKRIFELLSQRFDTKINTVIEEYKTFIDTNPSVLVNRINRLSIEFDNLVSKWQALLNGSDFIETYNTYYAKFLNPELKEFYTVWKDKLSQEIEKIASWSDSELENKLTVLFTSMRDYGNDTWMVFSQDKAVNLDSYTHITPFVRKDLSKSYNFQYDDVYQYMLKKATEKQLNIWVNWKDLNEAQKQEVRQLFEKQISIVKHFVSQLISKDFNLDQVALVLTRFLSIKVIYEYGYNKKLIDYITIFDTPIDTTNYAYFNCQGYSEFVYIALDMLGYKNLMFYGKYYKISNNEDFQHVNAGLVLDGTEMVIDATFNDDIGDWKNNFDLQKTIDWFIYNKSHYLVTKASYMNEYSLYYDKTPIEIKHTNDNLPF